jgi:hypothetical protein
MEVFSIHVYEYLASRKGISLAQSEELHQNLVHSTKQLGLKTISHRLDSLSLQKKWYPMEVSAIGLSISTFREIAFSYNASTACLEERFMDKRVFLKSSN